MRIDTSEPSLVALFNKGQVGLIRTEFMRKDDVIADLVEKNAALAAENERLAASVRRLEKENAMIQEASFAGAIVTKTVAAENQRFRKALKDVEKAWYEQRAMDVIRVVDEAFAWKDSK